MEQEVEKKNILTQLQSERQFKTVALFSQDIKNIEKEEKISYQCLYFMQSQNV